MGSLVMNATGSSRVKMSRALGGGLFCRSSSLRIATPGSGRRHVLRKQHHGKRKNNDKTKKSVFRALPLRPLKAAQDDNESVTEGAEEANEGGNIKQLLGMKGASVEKEDKWKVRLQLMKPVTWVPLIWGVMCGAAASGMYTWTPENVAKALLCMTMSGPLLTGYTQVINDYYDREIGAINEPYRPIPSGLISETEAVLQFLLLLAGGLGVAFTLDVALLTILYSIAGLGIAIVNDFKSIEGDRELGLKSLPVEFGIDVAKWITVGTIDLTQLAVAAYVYQGLDERWYSIIIQLLVIPQVFFQFKYFIPDPVKNDVKYQGAAQPFLVLGILMTGLAVGHHNQLLAGM